MEAFPPFVYLLSFVRATVKPAAGLYYRINRSETGTCTGRRFQFGNGARSVSYQEPFAKAAAPAGRSTGADLQKQVCAGLRYRLYWGYNVR